MRAAASTPLLRRFPALASVPRVAFGRGATPIVSRHDVAPNLWIKRDDLYADPIGGNKVRALEFLLGDIAAHEQVVTVGSAGSTHALSVVTYGKRLGAEVSVGRWRQVMNPAAERVSRRIARDARHDRAPVFSTPIAAYAWAWRERLRGARWIAAGGSVPLGILGHVNAGLELVEQLDAGALPQPTSVVVPLGTGGTAAGLALAFAIAGRPITVVGVRVVPRAIGRRPRILRLARRTAALIERHSRERVPRVSASAVQVVHGEYGGAYGRETDAARAAATLLRDAGGVALDATYSAKAFAAALAPASREPTLFWLTFDSRILAES